MSETVEKNQKPQWLRRILLSIIIVAMFLLSGIMVGDYISAKLLAAEITKIKNVGQPVTFSELEPAKAQADLSQNARDHYDDVLAQMQTEALQNLAQTNALYRKNITNRSLEEIPDQLRQGVARMLNNLAVTLESLDKAANLPLYDFDLGIRQGREKTASTLLQVEIASFLLSLRTMELIVQKKDDDAARSTISSLKLLRIFDSCPTMLIQTGKAKCVSLVRGDTILLSLRANPSDESLEKLQHELETIVLGDELKKVFYAERVYQIQLAKNLIPQKTLTELLGDQIYELPERTNLPASSRGKLKLRFLSLRLFRDMARLITVADKPWPQPLDILASSSVTESAKKGSLAAGAATVTKLVAQNTGFINSALLTVASERYKRANGQFPEPVDKLEGTFIDSIPINLFTGNKIQVKYTEE